MMLNTPVVVVGSGTMGCGIAQVALASGHAVFLVDAVQAQLERAQAAIFKRLTSKGASETDLGSRLSLHTTLKAVASVATFEDEADAPLIIEAIVENLEVKRALLAEAQTLFGPRSVYATNTSSFSVTAIATGVPYETRVIGMHFFNPVPVMKLVEIVPGVQSDPDLVTEVKQLTEGWGKTPILAKSTPGFIVNRVARPYYGEALRLAEEGVAPIDVIDRLLREAAAFRMGPFELMDLVGNDVNLTVTRTVWEGHHFDPRFTPSNLQGELVAAGMFGRKTGRGFYDYTNGERQNSGGASLAIDRTLSYETAQDVIAAFAQRLNFGTGGLGAEPGSWDFGTAGVMTLTRGRTAAEEARRCGAPVVVVDRPLTVGAAGVIAYATSEQGMPLELSIVEAAEKAGLEMIRVKDLPGLVVARVVSMLVNEAAEAVHLGLCGPRDVDLAMQLGTNYPLGLLEWGDRWGSAYVEGMIDALSDQYRDPRYRASLELRAATWNDGRLAAQV